MNMLLNQARSAGGKTNSNGDELISALDALQPGEHQQKSSMFAKAFPGILRAIARKGPQKDILSSLSRSGLKLHPVRYRAMLEVELKLRNEQGERICCETCGSVLQLPQVSEFPSAGENVIAQFLKGDSE